MGNETLYLILFIIAIIIMAIMVVPLIIYSIIVVITLVWSQNAEQYLYLHGEEYSYRRVFTNSLMGPFYIYNYYYYAFGTISLDIFTEKYIDKTRIRKSVF